MWKILTRTGSALLLAAALLAPVAASAQVGSSFLPQHPALGAQDAGDELPLQTVISIARKAGNGDYLNANRERGSVYRVKIIRPDGVVVYVFVDAKTGNVLGVRDR